MITMGPVNRIPAKIELRTEMCEYCRFARVRLIDKEEKIICARKGPKLQEGTGIAIWPIVEPTYVCGEFRYNNG